MKEFGREKRTKKGEEKGGRGWGKEILIGQHFYIAVNTVKPALNASGLYREVVFEYRSSRSGL